MKYICEVNYNNGHHEIVFVKAKNGMHLEYKMVEHLIKVYGSLDYVKGISYCPLKPKMFKEMWHYFGGITSSRLCMQKTHDNWLGRKSE